jgi:FimV-like protein
MLDRGHTGGARQVIQELKREWRGNRQGEYAATVMDSLCLQAEGEPGKARAAMEEALRLHQALAADADPVRPMSNKIAIDLAQACLAAGDSDAAQAIMRKVAAENNENKNLISRIEGVFAKSGQEDVGRMLLDEVNREIIELNNRGVLAARSGNLEESVRMLIDAAETVPSVQFLANAVKAICALMDQRGWRDDLAEQAQRYLRTARGRDAKDWRVITAQEVLSRICSKYGKSLG